MSWLQKNRNRIAAVFLAALILALPAAAKPGYTAEISQAPAVTGTRSPAAFSTGMLKKTEGGQADSTARSDPAFQAIRKIRSSAETEPLQRITLTRSSASGSVGHYTPVAQNSGYRALTSDAERTLYDFIAGGAYQVANEAINGYYPIGQVSILGRMSQAQIQEAFMAYTNDNPQTFWLSNVFNYGYEGNSTILQLYSNLSADGCNAAIDTFNSKLQQVVQSIPAGLSEFDREAALYHYIINQCSYNYAAEKDTGIWQAFTAYGALTDGKVVCEGYSRAMELLSSYVGLQCALIRGSSGGVGHMWNAVNISGNWYNLDLTWCDGNQPVYNYFNITDQVIRQTHQVAPAASSLSEQQIVAANSQVNLFLPSCTATAENYYQVKGIKISDLGSSNDGAIVRQVANELQQGVTTVAFYIDAGGKYTTVVNGLVAASPYKMKSYLREAASQSGKTVKKASYVVDSANHGLEICVTY